VVFTHRPLFDLKPEWEWFTSDGDDVMNVLAPYENVTVLYGHIHRDHGHDEGHAHHYAARSLIFAFPDPDKVADKKPNPFDKGQPFRNLGIRVVNESAERALSVKDVELTLREFSGDQRGAADLARARDVAAIGLPTQNLDCELQSLQRISTCGIIDGGRQQR
jgi:hypothetical protein